MLIYAAMPSLKNDDLEKYAWEIKYERSRAKAYKDSLVEWRLITAELEKQIAGAAREPNEWKTRCETQIEYNEELQQQVKDLARRVHTEREMLRNPAQIYSGDPSGNTTESDLKTLVKQLTREKNSLESQIRDTNWRLDEEAKAFHKADEKRKVLLMDAARSRQQIITEHAKKDEQYLKRALANMKRELKLRCAGKGKHLDNSNLAALKSFTNTAVPAPIPDRFLARRPTLGYTTMNILRRNSVDPSAKMVLNKNKGPIKATVPFKVLPKLENKGNAEVEPVPLDTAKDPIKAASDMTPKKDSDELSTYSIKEALPPCSSQPVPNASTTTDIVDGSRVVAHDVKEVRQTKVTINQPKANPKVDNSLEKPTKFDKKVAKMKGKPAKKSKQEQVLEEDPGALQHDLKSLKDKFRSKKK